MVSAEDGSAAATAADGSVPLLEGDSLVDLSLPSEAWRSNICKGYKVYGRDSVGDWYKVSIVSQRHVSGDTSDHASMEVLLHCEYTAQHDTICPACL